MQSGTSTAAAAAPNTGLTQSEIELANLHLERTREGVVAAITGLTEAQWRFKPAAERWSIAEIAEHIAIVQERVLGRLRGALSDAPPPPERNVQQIDAIILEFFPKRVARFQAPEALAPKGDWTIGEAYDHVTQNTREIADCLTSIPDLRQHALDSPPLKAITKGEHVVMDGYQWILAASAHTERHTDQIFEVKADSNFPRA